MTSSLLLEKNKCVYTSCYCEENVWKLCQKVFQEKPEHLTRCKAVFLSNKRKAIPLWRQKAGQDENFVMWDYHVIFLEETELGTRVYDLDTTLPFPVEFETYLSEAICDESNFKDEFKRKFRVISAANFLKLFASDRSHMLDQSGNYLKPPPDYEPIKTVDSLNNIDDFISMETSNNYGTVMDLSQFRSTFANK